MKQREVEKQVGDTGAVEAGEEEGRKGDASQVQKEIRELCGPEPCGSEGIKRSLARMEKALNGGEWTFSFISTHQDDRDDSVHINQLVASC